MTRLIESRGRPWVSELEGSRHILWQDQWQQIDEAAAELRREHSKSFRVVHVRSRNGESKTY